MASLADVIIKGGVGTIGVIASAYTLTKFIVATPVKIGDRSDEERDKDVVLCIDAKNFAPAAIKFFLETVRSQSRLRIDKKRVHLHKPLSPPTTTTTTTTTTAAAETEENKETPPPPVEDPAALAEANGEAYYLVGAPLEALKQIKARKEKVRHAELFDEADGKPLTSGERIELIMFELSRLLVFPPPAGTEASIPSPFQENDSLFAQALHSRLIKEHFPLHDDRERHKLVESWVKKYDQPQPLDAVHDYFGDEIGFYFAFLGMYTTWLVVPTVIGLLVFLVEILTPYSAYGRAFYSLFITSWATAFLKFWKRRESTLRNQWDISLTDPIVLDQERPDFMGERRYDPVDDRHFTYFSSIHRMRRYLVTTVVTLAVLGVILQLMFLYFDVDKWVSDQVTEEKGWEGYYQYASLGPSIAYSVVVLVLDMKYLELATWLTTFENHRTDADFSNALVLKLASFYFVNNFGSLFFLAFRSRDMELLEQTLSSLLITRQLIGNVKEQLVPYFTATSSLKAEAGKIAKEEHVKVAVLSKVDAELLFPTYDGTFDDYLELFVQFGQVTLFASAYPLAALWSLTNNIMEIRSDAFKLCASFRRSRRIPSAGIGTWFYAFNALGYMSVMTNCAIIGLHSGLLDKHFPALSYAGILVAVGAFEHIMVGIKVSIELLVPDVPTSVLEAQRMERALLRKKAILQAELSSRKLVLEVEQSEARMSLESRANADVDKSASREKMIEWLRQEKERRGKLEQEVKTLNDLYMGWIREEQEKRKIAEAKVAELLKETEKPEPVDVAKAH